MLHEFQHLFQEGITSAAEGSFHTPHIHALFSSLISDLFIFLHGISFFWTSLLFCYYLENFCPHLFSTSILFHSISILTRGSIIPGQIFAPELPFKCDRVAAAVTLPNI